MLRDVKYISVSFFHLFCSRASIAEGREIKNKEININVTPTCSRGNVLIAGVASETAHGRNLREPDTANVPMRMRSEASAVRSRKLRWCLKLNPPPRRKITAFGIV